MLFVTLFLVEVMSAIICLVTFFKKDITKTSKIINIVGFAISSDTVDFIYPCGACRQVMAELLNETVSVFLINKKEEIHEVKVKKLLPYAFKGDDLNG